MWSDVASDYKQFLARIHGTKPQAVWVQAHGIGMEIPFEELHIGDVVVVNPGDVIPVAGVIVEGKAEVSQWLAPGFPRLLIKGVGDHVVPATLILTGKLCLRVENLA
jgi:Cu2+-exporting ATPase